MNKPVKTLFERQLHYWTHMLDEAMNIGNTASIANAKKLSNAQSKKYDEFYIKYEDCDPMLRPFSKHFRNKKIFMNCDSPNRSWLYFYLFEHFEEFGLKELAAIGYGDNEMQIISSVDELDNPQRIPVTNKGDMFEGESLAKLDDCDIVIGNPPFSSRTNRQLGVDFFALPIQHGKDVIGIETPNMTTFGKLKNLILSRKLRVYTSPYDTFNVPIDSNGNRASYDTGVYEDGKVEVYIFSTFQDAYTLKRKLEPFFQKAYELGARYEDLPDSPSASRIDVKMLYNVEMEKDGKTTFCWIPRKPKPDGIHRPLIAISRYKILGYNWERYFNLVDVKDISGTLRNPRTSDPLLDKNGNEIRVNAAYFIFEYK